MVTQRSSNMHTLTRHMTFCNKYYVIGLIRRLLLASVNLFSVKLDFQILNSIIDMKFMIEDLWGTFQTPGPSGRCFSALSARLCKFVFLPWSRYHAAWAFSNSILEHIIIHSAEHYTSWSEPLVGLGLPVISWDFRFQFRYLVWKVWPLHCLQWR